MRSTLRKGYYFIVLIINRIVFLYTKYSIKKLDQNLNENQNQVKKIYTTLIFVALEYHILTFGH
jgi:hypothetical protein